MLGGAPVSNSSAGKPDLKAFVPAAHGTGVYQLTGSSSYLIVPSVPLGMDGTSDSSLFSQVFSCHLF